MFFMARRTAHPYWEEKKKGIERGRFWHWRGGSRSPCCDRRGHPSRCVSIGSWEMPLCAAQPLSCGLDRCILISLWVLAQPHLIRINARLHIFTFCQKRKGNGRPFGYFGLSGNNNTTLIICFIFVDVRFN